MANFDFIGWLATNAAMNRQAELEAELELQYDVLAEMERVALLEEQAEAERTAQIQNTYDHQYYDRPVYQNIETNLDAPGRGDGATYMPNSVRDYYEDSRVTNAPLTVDADVADQGVPLDPGRKPWFDDTTKDHGWPDYNWDLVDQEHYDDIPTGDSKGHGYYEHFYPVDTVEKGLGDEQEGEQRFEDLDGSEPLGRDYYQYHPESTEANDPEGSFEGQLPSGYQQHEAEGEAQHEAEFGVSLRELTGPGRDSSPLDDSPETGDPADWMGRASNLLERRTAMPASTWSTGSIAPAQPVRTRWAGGLRVRHSRWARTRTLDTASKRQA